MRSPGAQLVCRPHASLAPARSSPATASGTTRTDADYAELQQISRDLKQARRAAAHAQTVDDFYPHALATLRLAISRKARRSLRTAELPELLDCLQHWSASDAAQAPRTTLHRRLSGTLLRRGPRRQTVHRPRPTPPDLKRIVSPIIRI